ncbi:MAG: helix-turn-helix domain-containing protein [Mycetocola sp.]
MTEFATVAQAAKRVGVDPSTVHKWVKDHKIAKYGTGRAARVILEEVLKAEADGRSRTGRPRKNSP